MTLRKLVSIAAGAALVAAPVAAQAAPVRVASPVAGDSENLAGGSLLIPALVFAAVTAFLALVLFDDGDEPVSP